MAVFYSQNRPNTNKNKTHKVSTPKVPSQRRSTPLEPNFHKAKKHYFEQYKKDGPRPPCIELDTAIQGFNIDNTAAYQAIEDSKALHARRWQTKEGMYRIKRRALPDVGDAPLQDDNAAASCSDGKPRWRSWDGDYAMGYQRHPYEQDNGYLMLPPGVLHMSVLGRFGRFTLFSPPVSHSKHLPCSFCFVLCFGFGVFVALLCFCFLFCKCFGILNSQRSLDLDDRQGLISSSAMQQKKEVISSQTGWQTGAIQPRWELLISGLLRKAGAAAFSIHLFAPAAKGKGKK